MRLLLQNSYVGGEIIEEKLLEEKNEWVEVKNYKILFWLSFITSVGFFVLNLIEENIYLLVLGWIFVVITVVLKGREIIDE